MHEIITRYLDQLVDPDRMVFQDAYVKIMCAFERSSRNYEDPFWYDELPPSLLTTKLSIAEQREIVEALLDLAQHIRFERRGTLLFAVSKAHSLALAEPLLIFIRDHGETIIGGQHYTHTTMSALENCIYFCSSEDRPAVDTLIQRYDPRPFLQRAILTPTTELYLLVLAERVLSWVDHIFWYPPPGDIHAEFLTNFLRAI